MSQPSVDGETLSDPEPHSEVIGPEVALRPRDFVLAQEDGSSDRSAELAGWCFQSQGWSLPLQLPTLTASS